MINISYFYDPLESIGNRCQLSTCSPQVLNSVDLYFTSMPACTTLLPNANFGLSDWSQRSSV